MNIIDLLLTNPDARSRRAITPKGVVLHWVANPGSTARNNRDYFQNGVSAAKQNWASAHYVIDDRETVRCIPEMEMAYHVGATSYNQAALKQFATTYPNDCLIGIELCHADWTGTFGTGTWSQAVELVADILRRYKLPVSAIVRHYDITGKECPRVMVRDPAVFTAFKADVERLLNPPSAPPKQPKSPGPAPDVSGDHFAAEAVAWAYKHKISAGIDSQKNFAPDRPVTRAEMIVLLKRTFDLLQGGE
ncbi:hypothetical protein CIG75_03195 [Tumebacillus algifaecis]|uniref:N-acetylmuramoyl-L-alanine amidase n=1 Tax=Tumebacillus algifaecis TaxID=1214604 RepID=A0A223CXP7_9BACL|nr:N-acetylmuramoyl-L-alanine amidase [Tumebacillus algifaecis]ASS74088.1 hypothetical protein CIG75_03195 [Tumebacillus algifaecis]